MPAGLIDEKRRVCARRDLSGDFGQVRLFERGDHSGTLTPLSPQAVPYWSDAVEPVTTK
jgi:hypothetical protein